MNKINNIVSVRNLVKTYGQKIKTDVLKNINLDIKEGSFNWIVGASGSGKTTLLNIISGLDMPSLGDIIIDDTNITKLNSKELAFFRANHLGFIFQFHYLIPELKAIENVLLPLRIKKDKITKEAKQAARDLMESVGIWHVHDHYPKQMSGGEQQRVAVARAVFGRPKLVLADEPTGNLDSQSALSVYELLRLLHQTLKTTFIIVTHDKVVPLQGDRMITLKDGIIIKDVTY